MEDRRSKSNSYDVIKGAYKITLNVSRIAKIGVFGGLLTLHLNFAIISLLIAVLFNNAQRGAYVEFATCDEYQRSNEIFECVYREMKKNINVFK
ncbi:MAG: hypothetical protein K2G03_07100, partial [Bacilli bacterium]|nr:hypothetical protein [Bacilli bacterium]